MQARYERSLRMKEPYQPSLAEAILLTLQKTETMSYVQLIYHAVIRTKASKPTLSIEHSDELYRYIWGIIKNKQGTLYRVNGMKEHVHILFSLHPTIALSDFMRDLKAGTSKNVKVDIWI